jgi:hypothetical protein
LIRPSGDPGLLFDVIPPHDFSQARIAFQDGVCNHHNMFPESELAIHRATHSIAIVHPEPDLPDLGALCSGQRH